MRSEKCLSEFAATELQAVMLTHKNYGGKNEKTQHRRHLND